MRPELLRQLLAVELSYRQRHEDLTELDEYRRRFPGHAELVDRMLQRAKEAGFNRGPSCGSREPAADSETWQFKDSEKPTELPDHIGRYRVVRRLGQGGQATALLAYDPDLERHVVLKRYHLADHVRASRAGGGRAWPG